MPRGEPCRDSRPRLSGGPGSSGRSAVREQSNVERTLLSAALAVDVEFAADSTKPSCPSPPPSCPLHSPAPPCTKDPVREGGPTAKRRRTLFPFASMPGWSDKVSCPKHQTKLPRNIANAHRPYFT